MGREIRRVPPNWNHPINSWGAYQPMHEINYSEAAKEWIENFYEHEEKKLKEPTAIDYGYYWEYDNPPDESYCVPYRREEATWYQVYETVSEGTPVTPPFETQEELIDHLVCFGESLIGKYNNGPVGREAATRFVMETQWVMSGMLSNGEFKCGIGCLEP